jgi:alkylhydroperoxidase/carboxymuconolactone decarboxylase family protein YurZ
LCIDLKDPKQGIMEKKPNLRRLRPAAPRRASSGNWNPDWEPFAKLDPAWTEKVIAVAISPAVAGVLDKKTAALVGIALDASCTNLYAPGIRRHVQRALKAGATKEEITAVLQLTTLQGLHSMCVAGPILLEELELSAAQTTEVNTLTQKETP